jgi:Putative transposase
VVTYLARSLRGGPLKNARLVAWDGERVTFTYRTRADEQASGGPSRACLTLSSADFLQRWLLHVPAPQTRTVRSYGLSHHTYAEGLARCRAQVGQPPMVVPVVLDWQTACAQ